MRRIGAGGGNSLVGKVRNKEGKQEKTRKGNEKGKKGWRGALTVSP